MVFSSIIFIFKFLPLALLVYFLSPNKYKNVTILVFSLFFYTWGEPKYFPLMIISIVLDFYISKAIDKNNTNRPFCKKLLFISLFGNLGMLFLFKYSNFFINNLNEIFNLSLDNIKLTLPLGISFYTFQTLSYTIDVYRGNVEAEKNIIDFGVFVSLFPQLIAGPIVKYTDINSQLKNRVTNISKVEEGIGEFILGLSKKTLIANNIGSLWTEVSNIGFSNISTPLAWLAIISFSLQIYFDFSGYSSMAIGLGKILGFDFPQNFNFPYVSRSMTEFWRRWHITLGDWFKEYVYIPLGGSRVSKGLLYRNLLIVWLLTGFWHGAEYNFILWGLFFFVTISLEKIFLLKFLNKNSVISHLYAIFLLLIGWSIFAIPNLSELYIFLDRLLIFKSGVEWKYYLENYIVIITIGCLFSLPITNNIYNKIKPYKFINSIILMILFITCIAYLVDSTYNPFLYFRF